MNHRGKAHDPVRVLCLTAHPDDEVFCAGGTLAKWVAAGGVALVAAATRGEAGQIRDARAATRRTLGAVREQELRAACTLLGVQYARCLAYTDGTLGEVDPEALRRDVVRIIREFRPDVVITFGPDGAYGHPDHIAISRAATEAFFLAGADRFPDQLVAGLSPHTPARLYHSHFPRSRLLLSDHLAHWLTDATERFRGTDEFVQTLCLFAEESTVLRYASDHVDIRWFPAGFAIIEQGEPGASLYLILSGQVDVFKEDAAGTRHRLAQLGPGEFFGELALARRSPRSAHVVAAANVTCLVLSGGEPAPYAGRGQGARLAAGAPTDAVAEAHPAGATACIDVGDFVERKIAAIAAHRTQYPIRPDLFPSRLLREMFGREYFVRVHPPVEPEDRLWPGPLR